MTIINRNGFENEPQGSGRRSKMGFRSMVMLAVFIAVWAIVFFVCQKIVAKAPDTKIRGPFHPVSTQ